MDTKQREWWSRPMFTRTLEPCPHCKQLAEGVEQRTIYGPWGQRFTETCCIKCLPEVQEECSGTVLC